jgi:hypothetical protein
MPRTCCRPWRSPPASAMCGCRSSRPLTDRKLLFRRGPRRLPWALAGVRLRGRGGGLEPFLQPAVPHPSSRSPARVFPSKRRPLPNPHFSPRICCARATARISWPTSSESSPGVGAGGTGDPRNRPFGPGSPKGFGSDCGPARIYVRLYGLATIRGEKCGLRHPRPHPASLIKGLIETTG